MNLITTFDNYAVNYQDKFNLNPLGRYQRELVQGAVRPFLSGRRKLLDVGCGPGSDFEFYHSLNLSITAIDISPEMARLARDTARALGLDAEVATSALQDFHPPETYEVILLNFGVINAIADLDAALEKLHGLLADAGILIVVAMPPFHLFSFLGNLLRGRIAAAFRRVFQGKAVLSDGLEIFYYRQHQLERGFRLLERRHLCPLLPTPDQYVHSALARFITKLLLPLDRRIAHHLPDWSGGDHVCYIFEKVLRVDSQFTSDVTQ